MSQKYSIALLFFMAFSGAALGQNELPVDKKATSETVHLYNNLKKLRTKGFLFGHQDDLAYGVQWKYVPGRSDIKDVTGDYPALYGWELGRLELDHPMNLDSVPFQTMKKFITEAYTRGGVITISWHLNNPLSGGSAWQPEPGTVASVLPGGQKHDLYKSWLDKVADFMLGLKGSRGEYIPVIFRPFHELNGDWFWWGGKNCTPEEIKQLYRFTVTYLRDQKNIHHILYAFNTDRFPSKQVYLERYPGDDWVDIIGFDIYQGNNIIKNEDFVKEFDRELTTIEELAREKNKIPALTEFGFNGLPDSTWWTKVFLKTLDAHHVAYVLAWRNAGFVSSTHTEIFVPYKGQVSANDFVDFYNSDKTIFQKDITLEKIYQ